MIGRDALDAVTRSRRNRPSIVKTYDERFFDEVRPSSAYWAGFLAADGSVRATRNTVSLRLSGIDYGHLRKFCRAIRYSGQIKWSGSSCAVHINGPAWIRPLAENFNIIPRKSLVYRMPSLSEEALPHFIRGLIDGDGSLTKAAAATLSLTGTAEVLIEVAEIVYSRCGVRLKSENRVPPVCLHSNGLTGQISWSGINAGKILDWVYAASAPEIQLDRKHQRWTELWPVA